MGGISKDRGRVTVADDWFGGDEQTSSNPPRSLPAKRRSQNRKLFSRLTSWFQPSRMGRLSLMSSLVWIMTAIVCLANDNPNKSFRIMQLEPLGLLWIATTAAILILVSKFSRWERIGLTVSLLVALTAIFVTSFQYQVSIPVSGSVWSRTCWLVGGAVLCSTILRGVEATALRGIFGPCHDRRWLTSGLIVLGILGPAQALLPAEFALRPMITQHGYRSIFLVMGAFVCLWVPVWIGIHSSSWLVGAIYLVNGGLLASYFYFNVDAFGELGFFVSLVLLYAGVSLILVAPNRQVPKQPASGWRRGLARLNLLIWILLGTACLGLLTLTLLCDRPIAVRTGLRTWDDFEAAFYQQRLKYFLIASRGNGVQNHVIFPNEATENSLNQLHLEKVPRSYLHLENLNQRIDVSSISQVKRVSVVNSRMSVDQFRTLCQIRSVDIQKTKIEGAAAEPFHDWLCSFIGITQVSPDSLTRFLDSIGDNPSGSLTLFIHQSNFSDANWESIARLAARKEVQIELMLNRRDSVDSDLIPRKPDLFGPENSLELRFGKIVIDAEAVSQLIGTHISFSNFVWEQEIQELTLAESHRVNDLYWGALGQKRTTDAILESGIQVASRDKQLDQGELEELHFNYSQDPSVFDSLYLYEPSQLTWVDPQVFRGLVEISVDPSWLQIGPPRFPIGSRQSGDLTWSQFFSSQPQLKLEALYLSEDFLFEDYRFLSAMPNLKTLQVSGTAQNPVAFNSLSSELQKLSMLETVILIGGTPDPGLLSSLANLPSLKQVVVRDGIYSAEVAIWAEKKLGTKYVDASKESQSIVPSRFKNHHRRVIEQLRKKYSQTSSGNKEN